jgi:hypothetical protein
MKHYAFFALFPRETWPELPNRLKRKFIYSYENISEGKYVAQKGSEGKQGG